MTMVGRKRGRIGVVVAVVVFAACAYWAVNRSTRYQVASDVSDQVCDLAIDYQIRFGEWPRSVAALEAAMPVDTARELSQKMNRNSLDVNLSIVDGQRLAVEVSRADKKLLGAKLDRIAEPTEKDRKEARTAFP